MPLFFFHFIDGADRQEDDIGIEKASAEDAYLEAMAGAKGMWADLLTSRRNPLRCAFDVCDAAGESLFVVRFAELIESLPDPSVRLANHALHLADRLRETHLRAQEARASLTQSMATVRGSLEESSRLLSRLRSFERRTGFSAGD